MLMIVRRQLTVLGSLALGVVLLAGCAASGGHGGGDYDQQRRDLDKAGRQLVATLNEVVPLIGAQLSTTLRSGFTGWESCTLPPAGDARAQAQLQFDALGVTQQDALGRLSTALKGAGWKVDVNPAGGVTATRAGFELKVGLQGIVQSVSLQSACVKTSTEVDKEYAERPPRHLPVPWPDSGLS